MRQYVLYAHVKLHNDPSCNDFLCLVQFGIDSHRFRKEMGACDSSGFRFCVATSFPWFWRQKYRVVRIWMACLLADQSDPHHHHHWPHHSLSRSRWKRLDEHINIVICLYPEVVVIGFNCSHWSLLSVRSRQLEVMHVHFQSHWRGVIWRLQLISGIEVYNLFTAALPTKAGMPFPSLGPASHKNMCNLIKANQVSCPVVGF